MNQFDSSLSFIENLITSEEEVFGKIEKTIRNNHNLLVTYFNQNSFNEFHRNPGYRKTIQTNFEIFCDGRGMALAFKFLFGKKVGRFNATDLYTKIFNKLYVEKVPVYFIGSNYENETIVEKSKGNLVLAGYTKGFFSQFNIDDIIQNVKESKAKIIVIGMGIPKQEITALKISLCIENCIILCVGNFFNYYFGFQKRAPIFLRDSGFEWIYRLFTEPNKLWKRYLIGIPKFISRIVKYKYF